MSVVSMNISYAGPGLSLFIILFFLTKRPRYMSDYPVILFAALLGLPMAGKILTASLFAPSVRFILFFSCLPLTFGPMLYIYTYTIVHNSTGFKRHFLYHTIPFILITLFFQSPLVINSMTESRLHRGENPGNQGPPPGPDRGFRNRPPRDFSAPLSQQPPLNLDRGIMRKMPIAAFAGYILIIISFICYSIGIFILLKKHKKNLEDYFSFNSSIIDLYWLELVTLAFSAANLYILLSFTASQFSIRHPLLNPAASIDRGYSFFTAVFGFFALRQERLFYKYKYLSGLQKHGVEKTAPDETRKNKYEKSALTDELMERYLDKIYAVMKNENPFHDPDFTISDLAEKTGILKHYISQTINAKEGKNFYSFINGFRLNDVLEKMKKPEHSSVSIIELAYSSGFNSKSSFNTFFKKQTGLTPSGYRKQLEEK